MTQIKVKDSNGLYRPTQAQYNLHPTMFYPENLVLVLETYDTQSNSPD